ncbi:helix-turn-helix transcriptional regulator [Streptomyces sp. BH-SS-21]|uniref:Helix-turn-helix transcriptional regulator n=1 Tax=Streptomyces liliiviolaceus TaxID=2823109 RepID=A0A941B4E8_9ACTN|nr:helix-turn-helix transcriptional regulator [Streptomyces liliiviolaceus]MBQ0850285.1 helix-turn-helix transcriptional regulator [Streptomyces liliiviolaceus]
MVSVGGEGTVTVGRTVFATRDNGVARQFLDAAYGSSFHLSGMADGQRLEHRRVDAGLFTVDRLVLPGTLSFTCEPVDRLIVIDVRAGGLEMSCAHASQQAAAGGMVLNPAGMAYAARTVDGIQSTVSVDPAVLRDVTGVPREEPYAPLRYPTGAVKPAAAQQWRSGADFAIALFADEATRPALLVSNVARLLAATALTVFPLQPAPASRPADGVDATPDTVRRAVAFIDSNAEKDISLADIAAAAYVTPRAVQYAFRRHLGTTPMAYLRRTRLDGAHQDLLSADPNATTVAAIAARWGFWHPGRFAVLYRTTYGRIPSHTLHS